jgi:hypothetical protein
MLPISDGAPNVLGPYRYDQSLHNFRVQDSGRYDGAMPSCLVRYRVVTAQRGSFGADPTHGTSRTALVDDDGATRPRAGCAGFWCITGAKIAVPIRGPTQAKQMASRCDRFVKAGLRE